MLEVSRQAGHSVAVCARHYAGIFEDYDPTERTSAEATVQAFRAEPAFGLEPKTSSLQVKCSTN